MCNCGLLGYNTSSGRSVSSGYTRSSGYHTSSRHSVSSGYTRSSGYVTSSSLSVSSGYSRSSGYGTSSSLSVSSGYSRSSGYDTSSDYGTSSYDLFSHNKAMILSHGTYRLCQVMIQGHTMKHNHYHITIMLAI